MASADAQKLQDPESGEKVNCCRELDAAQAGKKAGPLDGGWGWMCVMGCAIIHVVVGTTIRAFGMIYLALIERYRASATATAWTGAINFACLGFFGPIASMLCRKYGCRPVTIMSGLLTSSGIIATGYAPNIYVTYLTFGVITGFGLCLSYTSGFIILGLYFDKRKALAMSIGTFSSGVSSLICPPVMIYVFRHSGFQGMFLLVAGISLHLCVAGALFRPLEDNFPKRPIKADDIEPRDGTQSSQKQDKTETIGIHSKEGEDNSQIIQSDRPLLQGHEEGNMNGVILVNTNTTPNGCSHGVETSSDKNDLTVKVKENTQTSKKMNVKEMLKVNAKLFKTLPFFAMIFLFFSFNLGTSSSAFDVILAIERGVNETKAAVLISIAGVTSVITTIGGGFLLDLNSFKGHRLHIYNGLNLLFGLSCFGTASSMHYAGFVVSAILRGASSGLVAAQRATIISDIVGRDRTMEGLGLILMFGAFGTLFGRSLAGPIRDSHGEYSGIFYLSGTLAILSSLLFCAAVLRMRKSGKEGLQLPNGKDIDNT